MVFLSGFLFGSARCGVSRLRTKRAEQNLNLFFLGCLVLGVGLVGGVGDLVLGCWLWAVVPYPFRGYLPLPPKGVPPPTPFGGSTPLRCTLLTRGFFDEQSVGICCLTA